jgi:hypothetical protein
VQEGKNKEHKNEGQSSITPMHDRAYTTQLYADLCRRVASVGSQLLEHNLTDAGSVWDNTEQLIAQLQAYRDAFLLRQAGPDSSSLRVAEHATNNDKHAHPPLSGHQIKDSVRPANHAHLDSRHKPRAYLPPYVNDESEEAQAAFSPGDSATNNENNIVVRQLSTTFFNSPPKR